MPVPVALQCQNTYGQRPNPGWKASPSLCSPAHVSRSRFVSWPRARIILRVRTVFLTKHTLDHVCDNVFWHLRVLYVSMCLASTQPLGARASPRSSAVTTSPRPVLPIRPSHTHACTLGVKTCQALRLHAVTAATASAQSHQLKRSSSSLGLSSMLGTAKPAGARPCSCSFASLASSSAIAFFLYSCTFFSRTKSSRSISSNSVAM
jgi:hypothetical protein